MHRQFDAPERGFHADDLGDKLGRQGIAVGRCQLHQIGLGPAFDRADVFQRQFHFAQGIRMELQRIIAAFTDNS